MLYGITVFSYVDKYANRVISFIKVLNNFMCKLNQR